jgi:hypothetical protein
VPGRRGEVDLVHADAEGADGEQAGRGGEDALGDVRARPDAQQVDVADRGDQLILGQRPRGGLDLVAVFAQARGGIGVNVLQQQGAQRPVRPVQRQLPSDLGPGQRPCEPTGRPRLPRPASRAVILKDSLSLRQSRRAGLGAAAG